MIQALPIARRERQPRSLLPWQTPGAYPPVNAGQVRARDRNGPQFEWDIFTQHLNTGALIPNATALLSFQVPRTVLFEASMLNAVQLQANGTVVITGATAALGVIQMIDGASSRNLFHENVPIGAIAGVGTFPHILPIPRRFMPETTVNVVVTNLDSAITTTWDISLIGRRLVMPKGKPWPRLLKPFRNWEGSDGKLYAEDWFAYSFNFGTIAAGVTTNLTITVEEDADFEWVYTSGGAYDNVTTGTWNGPGAGLQLSMNVTDGLPPKDMQSGVATWVDVAGNGLQPFILPETHIFQAQTPMTVSLTNNGANPANQVMVVLEGRKIFELERDGS